MHGYCHYFAIEAAKFFGGKVVLWLDYDEINDRIILCHAYCEIVPNLYIDALGTFSDIKEREDEFEFNEKNIITYNSIEDAKNELKKLKIPFTTPQDKKEARDFLRNNMAVVRIAHNKCIYPVGIYANNKSFKEILFVSYSEKENHFSPLIHGFKYEYFAQNIGGQNYEMC
jgi:hypothetical protein